ncbi:c-type cytochrome [Endozoicomonas sp. GU-1]|uniref:c-type cytochrome n=2 Tax=Endozoicomonas sp. GU-1 TaxID=3009078 RepID=UPI0022B3839B|nr:c-type cytochrome [Endozoicomonas sp. GU-1]WBA85682.1 c-type cytochrome [Endozoicomonas sp. GU-1]
MKIVLKIKKIVPVAVFLLAGCTDQQSATQIQPPPQHLEAAQAKAMQLCAGCHGPTGIGTTPLNPNLACQKKEYMVKQLQYYRNGARTTHQPMSNIARLISEEEVESISEWYSITGCL